MLSRQDTVVAIITEGSKLMWEVQLAGAGFVIHFPVRSPSCNKNISNTNSTIDYLV